MALLDMQAMAANRCSEGGLEGNSGVSILLCNSFFSTTLCA